MLDARFVTIPLAGTLHGVHKVRGRADAVDREQRTLTFTDLDQRCGPRSWDRLVLTLGSVTKLFDIPGLAGHARGLKSTAEALYLRDHVLEQLELACPDSGGDVARSRRTIVVVGASYSGTELVTQLRALADATAAQMAFNPQDVKFLLLDLAEQVMPEVGKRLGNNAMRVLRGRGIDVRLGLTLKEVHSDYWAVSLAYLTDAIFTRSLVSELLTFPWVGFHAARPGSGGHRPPRVSRAMAIRASGL